MKSADDKIQKRLEWLGFGLGLFVLVFFGLLVLFGRPDFLPIEILRLIVPTISLGASVGFLIFLIAEAESPLNSIKPWIIATGTVLLLLLAYAAAFKSVGLRDLTYTDRVIIAHDGFTSMYFSSVTWTNLGYGDIVPSNKTGRALAACEGFTGYLVMAGLVAALTNQVKNVVQSVTNPEVK